MNYVTMQSNRLIFSKTLQTNRLSMAHYMKMKSTDVNRQK